MVITPSMEEEIDADCDIGKGSWAALNEVHEPSCCDPRGGSEELCRVIKYGS